MNDSGEFWRVLGCTRIRRHWKRDIVDTFTHHFCTNRHGWTIGTSFPYIRTSKRQYSTPVQYTCISSCLSWLYFALQALLLLKPYTRWEITCIAVLYAVQQYHAQQRLFPQDHALGKIFEVANNITDTVTQLQAWICLFWRKVKEYCNALCIPTLNAMGAVPDIVGYINAQLSQYTYTFPRAPKVSHMSHWNYVWCLGLSTVYRTERSGHAFKALSQQMDHYSYLRTLFQWRLGILCQPFQVSVLNTQGSYKVPMPMVALVSTAVCPHFCW